MIIAGECHHASAVTYEQILKTTDARYVYGLIATPTRKDGQHPILNMQLGAMIKKEFSDVIMLTGALGARHSRRALKRIRETEESGFLIVSPFLHKRRTARMIMDLMPALEKEVSVRVITRPATDFNPRNQAAFKMRWIFSTAHASRFSTKRISTRNLLSWIEKSSGTVASTSSASATHGKASCELKATISPKSCKKQ